MSHGELLTRLSVWLAIGAGALGMGMHLVTRRLGGARWAWAIGFVFFAVHVVCAFAFYHEWSHAAAWRETARQTAEMTGIESGGGLYVNYLFAAVWLIYAVLCWVAPVRAERYAPAWHGFFLFMVVNGTVVFGKGPVRWFGAVVCAVLVFLWWRSRGALQRAGSG